MRLSISTNFKTAIITGIFMFFLIACNGPSTIKLLSPNEGKTISNNMPTLTWRCSDEFKSFEIWIDGILMDTLTGTQKLYVPFPMSFGNHSWQVVGIKENGKEKSEQGTFTINDKPLSQLPAKSYLIRHNWKVNAASTVSLTGKELSDDFKTGSGWVTTSVPATVLTALVRNGVYPNPYVGFNNMHIPDADDSHNQKYDLLKYSHLKGENPWKTPYWYRTSFTVPDSIAGSNYWLNFNEINYKAEVWLNGVQLSDTSQMVGMERQFRFDITKALKKQGENHLAVAIYPLEYPGKPEPEPLVAFGEPGENMGDGMISKGYTKWDALGWDWQPPVRDRDMGITEDVFLYATDALELANLYVTSDMNLPDTTQANITISADLVNYATTVKEGKIKATISNGENTITFDEPFTLNANQTLSFNFDKEKIAALQIQNPKLWWAIGYGKPNLYSLSLTAETAEGEKTTIQTRFGIRKVETFMSKVERVYKLNGQVIYPKGGNWVIDMMLNWNASRYVDEILLTKNSGLNILRVWGPTGAPPSAFYDAADEHGILLWQDFLNDFWGTFKNKPGYLPNEQLFELATIDIVKKYRNHPSLVIWCGGNEGPNPREELIMNKILPMYDGRDSKHYLKISNGDGLHGGGPYHTMMPQDYFTHDKLFGFSSEIGPSGMPVYESMTKFITDLGENFKEGYFPVNAQWAYHDGTDRGSDDRKFSHYDRIVRNCYGNPTDVKDYMEKSQLVNYDVYRASIESINRLLWDKASGIALWKSNSSWPSVTWQLYDWYMQANAGLYGTKKASEMVHVQLNRDKNDVIVLNATHKPIADVTVKATLYDNTLVVLNEKSETISLKANSVNPTKIAIENNAQLKLLKLLVTDKSGNLISENCYWLQAENNYEELRNLPTTTLENVVEMTTGANRNSFEVSLKNTGSGVAFMTEIALIESESGAEILPSIYSDNYITLFPGESKLITITADVQSLAKNVSVRIKSYNQKETKTIVPNLVQ